MLGKILDNVKGDRCIQSSGRVGGVERYKGEGVFKANEGDKYLDIA